ncbi:MAG: flagellar hook-associated protein FlgK [Pseudomonadota bacterium]
MTLSATLANAMTGLNAASRTADLIANNVANALTEGYGRRDIELSPVQLANEGQGVRVIGISRVSDPLITGTRRISQAEAGQTSSLAESQERIADLVGEPSQPLALSTLIDRFETALTAASDTPEGTTLLSDAVTAAGELADKFNAISNEIRTIRSEADAEINRQINLINSSLTEVERLNDEIRINTFTGSDIAALQDQRQRVVDGISDLVPIKVIQRDNNQIALYTATGGQLLDGRSFDLEFSPTTLVTQDQTLANGALSGITLAGYDIPIGTGDGRGFYDGGALEAQFLIRDQIGPEVAIEIDALARNLIERLEGLPEDTTLVAGDPGLFTDNGLAFDPLNEEGIAGRISLNAQVDPSAGGDVTRLRDGLNAVAVGDVGDATLLRAMQDAIQLQSPIATGAGFSGTRSVAGFTSEFSGTILFNSVEADTRAATDQARFQTLSDAETNAVGVDTDAELARLLLVEQSFTANARVIQVVDELLARLINII